MRIRSWGNRVRWSVFEYVNHLFIKKGDFRVRRTWAVDVLEYAWFGRQCATRDARAWVTMDANGAAPGEGFRDAAARRGGRGGGAQVAVRRAWVMDSSGGDDDDDGDDDDSSSDAKIGRETRRAGAMLASGRASDAREILFSSAFEDARGREALPFAALALRAECEAEGGVAGEDALGALYALCIDMVRERANDEVVVEEWRRRSRAVALAMASRMMRKGDARAALAWLDALARSAPREPSYRSAAGRAHLMMGDLEGARLCFESAETLTLALGSAASEAQKLDVSRDRGEYLLAGARFREAKDTFDALLAKSQDATTMVNAAVAAVYNGDLDTSRALLERSLLEAKPGDVTPSAVKNLNSIYELTARVPSEAKHAMGVWVKSLATNDFDASCLAH